MTTPTDQFARLTLESPFVSSDTDMAPPNEIRKRAVQLQDILSSFHETELPSEFQPNVFNNIDQNMNSPSGVGSNHTIPGNLLGTLLQYGSYDDDFWDCLSRIQTPEHCARLFNEKLWRRFEACFGAYDVLVDRSPPAATARDAIQPQIDELVRLSNELNKDRKRRQYGDDQPLQIEAQTVAECLRALNKVCQRTEPIVSPAVEPSRRSTRRTAPASTQNLSLFGMLIRQADKDEPFFLDALEQFSGPALRQCLGTLTSLDGLLRSNGAPAFYIARFEALLRKAQDESQLTPSGASGRGRGREADPKPGQKRAGQAVETAPKRGKRAGGE